MLVKILEQKIIFREKKNWILLLTMNEKTIKRAILSLERLDSHQCRHLIDQYLRTKNIDEIFDANAVVTDYNESFLHIVVRQWAGHWKAIDECVRLLVIEYGASPLRPLNRHGASPLGTAIELDAGFARNAMLEAVPQLCENEIFDLLKELDDEWNYTQMIVLPTLLLRFYNETMGALWRFLLVCEAEASFPNSSLVIEKWEEMAALYTVAASRTADTGPAEIALYRSLFYDRAQHMQSYSGFLPLEIKCANVDEWIATHIDDTRRYVLPMEHLRSDALRVGVGLQNLQLPLLVHLLILDEVNPLYALVDFGVKWRMLFAVKHRV